MVQDSHFVKTLVCITENETAEHIEQGHERNLPGGAFGLCARENQAVKLVHMAQRPPQGIASTPLPTEASLRISWNIASRYLLINNFY